MSVQLSVFPQYSVNTNFLSNPNYDYLVDAQNWGSLNVAVASANTEIANASFVQNQINHFFSAGINLNQFYVGLEPPTSSTINNAGAGIVLIGLIPAGRVCLIQQVNNIVVGANYQFDLSLATTGVVQAKIYEYNGTLLVNTNNIGVLPSTVTTVSAVTQFSSTNPIIVIEFEGNPASSSVVTLNTISLKESSNQPIGVSSKSGEVLLDLYEDENIPLTLSIDDFTKVAEKVQSYSKSFNIPETKRNKRTFDNIFDLTRSADGIIFDPYKKTECILKVDGFVIFQGYLRLIDVNDKGGEVSYNINLYSEAIALKDFLEDRTIGDIDFTELEHDYQITNIKASANEDGSGLAGITYLNSSTSGYRDTYATVKYPFCDWKHQYFYSSTGVPSLNRLEDAFRPWLQIKYLINRIFENTPFTWKSTFFDTVDFEKLYMDFNWGDDGMPYAYTSNSSFITASLSGAGSLPAPITTSFDDVIFPTGLTTVTPINQLSFASGLFTSDSDNMQVVLTYNFEIKNTTASAINISSQINATIGGVATIVGGVNVQSIPASASSHFTANVTTIINLNNGDTFNIELKAASTGLQMLSLSTGTGGQANYNISVTNVATSDIITSKRGELSQWTFISGILKMFNMLTIPNENYPQEIQFETYPDVFKQPNPTDPTSGDVSLSGRGVVHDWTYKIDTEDIKLKPLTDLNKFNILKFVEDDDDHAFNVYKKATKNLYGSKIIDSSAASLLTGTKEIIAKPFAATVIKPLENYLSELIVPSICAFDSGRFSSFDNEPRILYNVGKFVMANDTYGYPAQNGGAASTNESEYLRFSHTTEIPSSSISYDFVFESKSLFSGVGLPTLNNLFNLYWLPYFSELYNSDTRILTLKINLSASDINSFSFFDLVYIKQRVFRVNRIDYKPKDLSTIELIMLP